MNRVLFVGEAPESVDFSDPSIPPGLNSEKIWAGIREGEAQLSARGWQVDLCMLPPDETACRKLTEGLRRMPYDCVVLGAGLRIPPKNLELFESLINVVHKTAPKSAIALNTRPEDTAAAAARWLPTS